MSFTQQDVGSGDTQDTSPYPLWSLDDGVKGGARRARAGESVDVAGIVKDDNGIGVAVRLFAV